MAKPRLIILVRHGQSEGNKNREIHQTIPDHRVKLTPEGWNQAHDAGRRLRDMLRPDDTVQFFTSPYRRTRETTEGILATLTSDETSPSPFRRSNIKVYEEPRLREQDFGNFQPCSNEMERMWQERADYGHFFYRIPNGESAADAYDRVSGFNESLWRQFGEDDFASVCVLVTHGLMSRVFLMKWYHFTVEYFEDLRNVNHCEFLIMRKQDNGKYLLENKLRTWSELRRERAALNKEKHKDDSKDDLKLNRSKTFVVTRRWGGCPNGCDHSSRYQKRQDLEVLRQKDHENGGPAPYGSSNSGLTIASRRQRQQQQHHQHEGSSDDERCVKGNKSITPAIDVSRTFDEGTVSSPDGTPSFISAEDRLRSIKSPHHMHVGRDGGGTWSGHPSIAGTDSDASEDEKTGRHRISSLDGKLSAPDVDLIGLSHASTQTNTEGVAINGDGSSSSNNSSHDKDFPGISRLGDAPQGASPAGAKANTNGVDGGAEPPSENDIKGHGHNHSADCISNLAATPQDEEHGSNDLEDLDLAEKQDRSIIGSIY